MAIVPNHIPVFTRSRRTPRPTRLAVVLAALFLLPQVAVTSEHHDEEELRLDADLTPAEVVTAAADRHPRRGLLEAQAATSEAQARYGSRWMPDATSVNAFTMSDRAFDDIGANETELGISFPVWMPGEKRARQAQGEAALATQAAREAAFRWQLSGEVRRLLWDLRLARRQWELAREQEQRLDQLLEQVTRFAEAGELARADLLSTAQELARWKAETIMLEAEYRDSERSYRALTGLPAVPATITEPLSEIADAGPAHPALRLAADELAEASAEADAVAEQSAYRPTVDVFWRGFRGDRNTPDVDALGIGFTVPLGPSPRRDSEVAHAREAAAGVETDYLQTQREVALQLHEARHQLETVRRQLANSETMMETAREKFELDRLAFELGELSTNQWLRRLSDYKDIERAHQLLQVRHGAAIAAYNQAVGESL
ncbi:MAG: TolC family protein [Xanthomonadales bacterium]